MLQGRKAKVKRQHFFFCPQSFTFDLSSLTTALPLSLLTLILSQTAIIKGLALFYFCCKYPGP